MGRVRRVGINTIGITPVVEATKAAQARELGKETYTGKPCRNCGGTERYTSNTRCVTCKRMTARNFWKSGRTKNALHPLTDRLDPAQRLADHKRAACATCTTPKNCRWCPMMAAVTLNFIDWVRVPYATSAVEAGERMD